MRKSEPHQRGVIDKEGVDDPEVSDALLMLHVFTDQVLAIKKKR